MAKNPSKPVQTPIWLVILLMTFLTAIIMLSYVFDYSYSYYGMNKIFTTASILLILSVAMLLGILWNDKKLLFWSGSIEFIILALPLLAFSTIPSYAPLVLMPIFIISFPVLWILLPIALMGTMEKPEKRKMCLKSLLAFTLFLTIIWIAIGAFYNAFISLILIAFLIIPAAIWALAEMKIDKPSKRDWKKLAPTILVIATLALLVFGYLTTMLPQDYTICGDGICDIQYEDEFTCPYDCQVYGEPESDGLIILEFKDAITGERLDGVAISILQATTGSIMNNSIANGTINFSLPSDEWYYTQAVKEGYLPHNGVGDSFYMIGGGTIFMTIDLEPI